MQCWEVEGDNAGLRLRLVLRIGLLCGVLLACHPMVAGCVVVLGAMESTLVEAR